MSSPDTSDPCDYIAKYQDLNKLKFQENEAARMFNVNDFNETYTLGRGICTVKLFEYKPKIISYCCIKKKIHIAVKIIPIPVSRYNGQQGENPSKRLIQEIQNLKQVTTHPNIINLYGLCRHKDEAWICMELMDMSLHEFYMLTHRYYLKFPEHIVGHIFIKIIDALHYCKNEKIIHRDLKPRNILLNKNGEIKLCDFGASRVIEESVASSYVGTIAYWPPERFMHINQPTTSSINNPDPDSFGIPIVNPDFSYGIRADIWSLGITLLEVVNGKLPYTSGNITTDDNSPAYLVTLQNTILNINGDELVEHCCGDNYTLNLKAFVKRCLSRVEDRPQSYNELKETPFYSQNKDQKGSQIISPVINDLLLKASSPTNQKSILTIRKFIALLLFCAIIFILLSILILSHFTAKPDPSHMVNICPSDKWIYYNETNFCYKFINNTISWNDAKQACNVENATLVSIHSADENNFIYSWAFTNKTNYDIAIGLYASNNAYDKSFQWIDNTKRNYTNWSNGPPEADQKEHCIFISQNNGGWFSNGPNTCGTSYDCAYVCKYPK